ncbi:sugar transferase [Thalassiella azotivora]
MDASTSGRVDDVGLAAAGADVVIDLDAGTRTVGVPGQPHPTEADRAHPETGVQARVRERRRHPVAHRASWGEPQPFEWQRARRRGAVGTPVEAAAARRARWSRPLVGRVLASDALVATGTVALTMVSLPQTRPWTVPGALLAAALWVATVHVNRGYDSRRLGDGPEEFQSVLRSAVILVGSFAVLSYALQVSVPRRDVLLAVPVVAFLSCVVRYSWRHWLRRRRQQGDATLRTLIVGDPTAVNDLSANLRRDWHHGLEIVGACVPVPSMAVAEVTKAPLLGAVAEVPQVVVDHDVDSVIVVGPALSGTPLRRLSWALEDTGADLLVAPGLVEMTGPSVTLRPTAGLSLLHVERPAAHTGRLLGKAVLDRTLGVVALGCALPVIAVAAVLVRLTSPGPAFFAQTRVGIDGRRFTMWKLRSMTVDAEARRAEIEHLDERDGLMFKMREDPRVTRVGRVLRRYSLDELPQLWNVVRGDMSLVGPRPPLLAEYEQYRDAVHRRLRVRPGLTGLWQVSGRADLPWDESVRLDLRYVDNWSLAMDLLILWKTARVVVRGGGAY